MTVENANTVTDSDKEIQRALYTALCTPAHHRDAIIAEVNEPLGVVLGNSVAAKPIKAAANLANLPLRLLLKALGQRQLVAIRQRLDDHRRSA
jgi:hypothetical protein